jgi:hypothetical protein
MKSTVATDKPFEPSFWEQKAENMIVKRISETVVFLVQVKGRDLADDFGHLHRRVTYPSKERLDDSLKKFSTSSEEEYEILLAAYFQVNEQKRKIFNEKRQAKFEQTRFEIFGTTNP